MKYFDYEEFDSPDKPGSGEEFMDKCLLKKLNKCREEAGMPLTINSGYRTVEHNEEINGNSNSSHLRGYAVDIACNDSVSRLKIIKSALRVGFRRIGVGETFIHLDTDPVSVDCIWTY